MAHQIVFSTKWESDAPFRPGTRAYKHTWLIVAWSFPWSSWSDKSCANIYLIVGDWWYDKCTHTHTISPGFAVICHINLSNWNNCCRTFSSPTIREHNYEADDDQYTSLFVLATQTSIYLHKEKIFCPQFSSHLNDNQRRVYFWHSTYYNYFYLEPPSTIYTTTRCVDYWSLKQKICRYELDSRSKRAHMTVSW